MYKINIKVQINIKEMKLKQVSEKDFGEYEIEVDDELYSVAEQIQKIANCDFPIIITNEGKELRVCYKAKERQVGERDTHRYMIKIEKISYL
jgi:hypothetical protein